MNTLTTLPIKAKQEGAALMISLIFIFMITVIGITAMKDATLEGQLANNAIQKEMTLQAAEAASNVLFNDEDSLIDSVCDDNPLWEPQAQLQQTAEQTTRARVEYSGRANPIGYSLGGPIGAKLFVVTGDSRIDSVSTGSRVSQGVIYIGAQELGDC
ncbi:MAG: PilX N-terminal domain-containing pilus assembly protein [Granulosicoccaceae bacterium]